MKKCPQCGREYDASMMFCLDDGAELLYGPASTDDPATAIMSADRISSEQVTRTFGQSSEAGLPRATGAGHVASKRNSIIAGIIGVALVTALGIGGYLFYGDKGGQIDSIAVLPFQNRSGDADSEYLSDGLAETLVFRLSQLPGLKVSPTSSVLRYKGKDSDAATIAKELGVDAVMTGRLVKRGENLNITVELIDARNNRSLWGEQYERRMSELLATQREIAATITEKLQLKLAGDEKGITKKYTESNEAYQIYLRARFHFARRTKDDMMKSIELFKQAVKIDPNFALAYVGIAESYTTIPSYPYGSPQECVPQAKAAVAKALELDPDLPEAHTVAGMIAATHDWDYPLAEREFKRSLELDPNLAITHYRYAWVYLSPMGRHDEAVAEMRTAMDLEPLSLQQGANYAAVLMYARRFDEAVEQAKRTTELDPTHIGGLAWLAHTYNAAGRYNEALEVANRTVVAPSYQPRAQRGISYAMSGQRENALRVADEWKEAEKSGYVMIYWLAATYAQLGDKDAAFAELEKSYQNRDWFLQRLKVDPFMDPLRGDPRFDAMIKRLNLPETP
jgi:TolB-like protein/Tfp pilus assembly protein PilF